MAWTDMSASAEMSTRSAMLVPGGDPLDKAKEKLDQLVSAHIYSVQVEVPRDPANLWLVDHENKVQDYEEAGNEGHAVRGHQWSRLGFEVTRSIRAVVIAPAVTKAAAVVTKTRTEPTSVMGRQPSKMSKGLPPQKSIQSKAKAGPAAKKNQQGLTNFFSKKAPAKAKVERVPDKKPAKVESRSESEDDDEDEGVQRRHKRRHVVHDSSDESDGDEDVREQELALQQAMADEQDSNETSVSADQGQSETAEEEAAEAAVAADAVSTVPDTAATAVTKIKKTRTFINAKGCIDTEEYWEEGEADAGAAPQPVQPKKKSAPKVAPATTKRSKKAAGSRDIMSFFKK